MVRKTLIENIEKALSSLGISGLNFTLEHPADSLNGDYATNVALVAAKNGGRNPKELSEKLKDALLEGKPEFLEKIEVAHPGFINFYITDSFFSKKISEIIERGSLYGQNKELLGKNIIIEYTDANPFKEFHIGHLMSNAIGEAISRIVEASGADMCRATYQGDVGLHIAKAIWGIQKGESNLGTAYANGADAFDKSEVSKKEIIDINQKIYDESDETINKIYKNGRAESLEQFESIYARLGTKFDLYFFESETGEIGKQIVEKNTPGVFEESKGAIVYRGEKVGLHTRVFITSLGLPTYEAKEIGLSHIKNEKWPHDTSVVVTGNEVTEYFKVALSALSEISPELSEKIVHIPHGMLRLASGKMSSRTGQVISAEDLLDDIKKKLQEKFNEDKKEAATDSLLDIIAIGAIKYAVLRSDLNKDIIFDLEKALSFIGDSGPYLQYTHARCKSLLKKGKDRGIHPKAQDGVADRVIERKLQQFPEVVERARSEYAPHYVCTYMHELASAFNNFYGREKIIDGANSSGKLYITQAVAIVIANGLALLGIQAPDSM